MAPLSIHVWSVLFTFLLGASAFSKGFLPSIALLAVSLILVRPSERQPKFIVFPAMIAAGLQVIAFAAVNIAYSTAGDGSLARDSLFINHRTLLEGFNIFEATSDTVGLCIQSTLPNGLLFLFSIIFRKSIVRSNNNNTPMTRKNSAGGIISNSNSGGGSHRLFDESSSSSAPPKPSGGLLGIPLLRIGGSAASGQYKSGFFLHVFAAHISVIVALLMSLAATAIIAPTYTVAPFAVAFIAQTLSLTVVRGRRADRFTFARTSLRVIPTIVLLYSMLWWVVVGSAQNAFVKAYILSAVNLQGSGLSPADNLGEGTRIAMRYLQAFLIIVAVHLSHLVVQGTRATDLTYNKEAIGEFDPLPLKNLDDEEEEAAFGLTYMASARGGGLSMMMGGGNLTSRRTARGAGISHSDTLKSGGDSHSAGVSAFTATPSTQISPTTVADEDANNSGPQRMASMRSVKDVNANGVKKSRIRVPSAAKKLWKFIAKLKSVVGRAIAASTRGLVHYFLFVPSLPLICVAANIVIFPSACTIPMLIVLWIGLLVKPQRFARFIPFISIAKSMLVMTQFVVLATDTWAPHEVMRAFFHSHSYLPRVVEVASNLLIFSIICATSFQHIRTAAERSRLMTVAAGNGTAAGNALAAMTMRGNHNGGTTGNPTSNSRMSLGGVPADSSPHWAGMMADHPHDGIRIPPSHINASRKNRVIAKLTEKRVDGILLRTKRANTTNAQTSSNAALATGQGKNVTTSATTTRVDEPSLSDAEESASLCEEIAAALLLEADPPMLQATALPVPPQRETDGDEGVGDAETTTVTAANASGNKKKTTRRNGGAGGGITFTPDGTTAANPTRVSIKVETEASIAAEHRALLLEDCDLDLAATFKLMVGRSPYDRELKLLMRYFRGGGNNNATVNPLLSNLDDNDAFLSPVPPDQQQTAATAGTHHGRHYRPTIRKWELLLWFYYNSKQSVWSQLATLVKYMAVQYSIPLALVSVFVMSTFVSVLDVLHGIALVEFLLFICFTRFAARHWYLVVFTVFFLTAFYIIFTFVAQFVAIPTHVSPGIRYSTLGFEPLETQWHAIPYFIASFAVAAVLSLSREEITTPGDLIAAFDWGRFLRKPLVIAWQRRVTLVAVNLVFALLAILQRNSLLIEGLLVVLLFISILAVNPQFPQVLQRWVWIIAVIYSAFAVLLVSLFQFSDIRAQIHEIFVDYSACASNDACERDIGVLPNGNDFVLTLFLAPWCVALVTSFVHLTTAVEHNVGSNGKNALSQSSAWFNVVEEVGGRDRNHRHSSLNSADDSTSMETQSTHTAADVRDRTASAGPHALADNDDNEKNNNKNQPTLSNTAVISMLTPRRGEAVASWHDKAPLEYEFAARTAESFSSPDQKVVHTMYSALLLLERSSNALLDVCGDYASFLVWVALYITPTYDSNLANMAYILFLVLDFRGVFVLLYCIVHILVIYTYGFVFVPTLDISIGTHDTSLAALLGIQTRQAPHYAIIGPLFVFYAVLLRKSTEGTARRKEYWDRRPIEGLTPWLLFIRTALFDMIGYELFIFSSLGIFVYASQFICGVVSAAIVATAVYSGRHKFLTSRFSRIVPFFLTVSVFVYQMVTLVNEQHTLWTEADVGEWWGYLNLVGTTQIHVAGFFCIVLMHLANDWQLCSVLRYQRLAAQHGPNRSSLTQHLKLQGIKSLTDVPTNEFDVIIPITGEETSSCCMAIVNQFVINTFYLFSPFAIASFVAGVDSPTILNLVLVVLGLTQLLFRKDLFWEFNWLWPRIYVPYFIILMAFPLIGAPTVIANWIAEHPTFTDVIGLSYNGAVLRLSWGKAVALFVAILQRRVFEEYGFETVLRRMQYQYDVETIKHEALMRRYANKSLMEMEEAERMQEELESQLVKIRAANKSSGGGDKKSQKDGADDGGASDEEGDENGDKKVTKNGPLGNDNDDAESPANAGDENASPINPLSLEPLMKRQHREKLIRTVAVALEMLPGAESRRRAHIINTEARYRSGLANKESRAFTKAERQEAGGGGGGGFAAGEHSISISSTLLTTHRGNNNTAVVVDADDWDDIGSFVGAEEDENFFMDGNSDMDESSPSPFASPASAERNNNRSSSSDVHNNAASSPTSGVAGGLGIKDRALEGTQGFVVNLIYRIHASSLAGAEDPRWASAHITIRLFIAIVTFIERFMSDFVLIFVVANFLSSGSVWDGIPCIVLFLFAAPWYPVAPPSVYDFVAVFLLVGVVIKTSVPLITTHVTFGPSLSKLISTIFVEVPVGENGNSIRVTVSTADVALDFVVFALILAHQAICSHNGAHAPKRRYAQVIKQRREDGERKRREEEHGGGNGGGGNKMSVMSPRTQTFGTIGASVSTTGGGGNAGVAASLLSAAEDGHAGILSPRSNPAAKSGGGDGTRASRVAIVVPPLRKKPATPNTNDEEYSREDFGGGREEEEDAATRESLVHVVSSRASKHHNPPPPTSRRRNSYSYSYADGGGSTTYDSAMLSGSGNGGHRGDGFFVAYINNILERHGMGWDLYSIMFAIDLISVIVFTLTYYFIQGTTSGSILTSVQNNLLPGPYVLVLFILIVLMVVDRVCFITRSLVAKWVLTVGTTLALMVGYVTWIHTVEPTEKALGLLFFFCKMLYVFVSCLQMRRGYAVERRHDPFTHDHDGILLWLGYQGYRAVPFLWELRVTIDWACERTALRFPFYLIVEDMYDIIYNRHVNISDSKEQQENFGDPISRGRKVIDGCTRIAIMIFVIVFPLFYYSSFNPATRSNSVTSAVVTVGFDEGAAIFESSIVSIASYPGDLGRWLQNTRPLLKQIGAADPQKSSQLISLGSCSNELWGISPQALRRMNNSLYAAVTNQSTASLNLGLQLQRLGSLEETVSTSENLNTPYAMPYTSAKLMYDALNVNMSDTNPSAVITVTLPHFYRPIILNQPASVSAFNGAEGDDIDCTMQLRSEYDANLATTVRYWCLKCNSLFTYSNFPNSTFPEWDCLTNGVGCEKYNFELKRTNYTPTSMYFAVISDRIPESISFLPNIGIIALYTTFVLAVGRVFRAMVAGSAQQAIYQYMHDPKPVDDLVRYIFVARAFGDLKLEQSLFFELIDLLRSPETLLAVTGRFPRGYRSKKSKKKGD